MTQTPPNIYADLRRQAFGVKASDLSIIAPADCVYGALMDLGIRDAFATVVAYSNGEGSVYLSNGGGFIGGGQHASVAFAAKSFVETAAKAVSHMKPVISYPLPTAGMTNFYAVTSNGVLFAEGWESEFNEGVSPLTPLFAAAQEVITAYRVLPRP